MRFFNFLLLLGCFTLLPLALSAQTFVGGFEGNVWTDYRNWSPQQVPGAGDEAVVPAGKLVVVNGAITVGSLILGGTIGSDGGPNSKLTITTTFSWTDGSVGAPLYLLQGSAALWQGSLGLNANLFNSGEVTVSGDVFINYAMLKNEADGVLNLTDGHKLQIINNPAVLDNYGTIRRTGLGGLFQILLGGHINRPGSETIVEAGELYASSLENYSPIQIAAGATFHSYNFQIYNGTTLSGSGKLKSTGNGIFMNNTDIITVDVAETELNSQGIKQTGPIVFLHHLDWKAGTLFNPVTFAAGCTVDINTTDGKGITGLLTNSGAINVNASFGFDYGQLDNHGTINLNGAFSNFIYHASEGIHNYGLIQKPVGAFGTYNMGVPLYNETGGQLLVQADELYCSANLYNTAEIIVYEGATLRSNFIETRNGSTFAGPGLAIIQNNGLNAVNTSPVSLNFDSIVLNANIGGNGAITLSGHVTWLQGDWSAPVTIASGFVVDMNPGGNHGISGTTTNNGIFNINTSFTLSAGQINNNGLLSLNGPYVIGIYYGTPGIFNHGTVVKPSNSAGVYNAGVPLTNYSDGSVLVENGELYVSSNFSNAGSLNIAAGATFRANNTLVENGASFAGLGTFVLGQNGLLANNTTPVVFANAETIWQASLSGTGTLTFAQHVAWQNANLNCPVIIANGATLDLTTNGAHGIGSTLTNNGTMNANVSFGGGTVNNNGTLNLAPELNFGGGVLNNAGTISNNAGGNETANYQVNNTGTIAVTAGVFAFNAGFSNAGAISVAAGANVQLENYSNNSIEAGASISGQGSFTVAGQLAVNADANIDIQNFVLHTFYGMSGVGALTFSHHFDWQSGVVANTIVIAANGILNINGVDFKNLSGTLTNNGLVNCNANLDLSPGAVINNSGSFLLASGNLFGPSYYVAGDFYNTGILHKTSADNLLFNTYLHNQSGGVFNIENAITEVGKLDNASLVSIASGAILIIKDGSNLAGGVVSGNGTLRIQGNGWFLSSSLTVNSLLFEIAGNLSGSQGATLEVQGNTTWYSGEISVPVNIATSGVFNSEGYGSKNTNAEITNNGVFNNNDFWYAGAGFTNNHHLFVSGSGGFSNYSGQVFTNSPTGLLIVSNNPYGVYLDIQTINNGTIQIEEGTVYMNNGFSNNALVTVQSGATLSLGGNDSFNSGSSFGGSGNLTVTNALTLNVPLNFSGEKFTLVGDLLGANSLTVQTTMDWETGDIQTDVAINPGATLNIGGSGGGGGNNSRQANYGQSLSATITNNGTCNQDGTYDMNGGAFINNGLFVSNYAGIYDGGNGGSFVNNNNWEVNAAFECLVNSLNNGSISGNGNLTFEPELDNYGIVSPGFSPGLLSFTHDFQNGAQVNIELESSNGPGVGYDYIQAGGSLHTIGTLNVTETGSLLDGAYTILKCTGGPGCRTGLFSNTNLPAGYTLSYTGQEVMVVKGQPVSISPADTTVCYGNPVTLTAPEAESYLWSTGETSQSIVVYPYDETTYTVVVNYAGGGGAFASAAVHVAFQPFTYIYPNFTTICQGESIALSAEGDPGTYLWSSGETTQTITVSPSENTYYQVSVTNNAGCTSSATAYVEVSGTSVIPNIEGVPTAACQNDESFELPAYQDGYYGNWSGPGVASNYFDPMGLSGNITLVFTPYPGQCAGSATWIINVLPSTTWYADLDADGYGNEAVAQMACTQPEGFVINSGDCNDANAAIHPGASEICNNIDDNCDGQMDEGNLCDGDSDGYTVSDGDCDDTNAAVHPGAIEICNNLDDDCDGSIDETNLILNLSVGDILCHGGTTTLSASATGGTAPYQYSFDSGPFSASNAIAVGSGTHTITVKDAHNCQYTSDYVVNEPTAIFIDPITVTHVVCAGGNTGAIDITVSGGVGPYTYHWSNNRTTQDIATLAPNTYTVTVTDANACTSTISATVNPKLALTLIKTNTTCNGGSDGSVTANIIGGTPGYTYLWSTGANTPMIENLSAGSYTLTVTDVLGCVRIKSISVGQPAAISISGVVQNITCNGAANGSIHISHNNGTAPFSYAWSDGATTIDRSELGPGTYSLTVTDVNGCTRSRTFTITQPSALSLNLTGYHITCNGEADGSITATTGGGVKYPSTNLCNGERYCYIWSNGESTRTISNLSPGGYSVTVTDANGCTISSSFTITEPNILEIADIQIEALTNGKYRLTVSAIGGTTPYKYKRIPGGSNYQSSNVFTNVPAGVYQIAIQDKNLCTDTTWLNVPAEGYQAPSSGLAQAINLQEETLISDESVQLYPNPAVDEVQIQINNEFQLAQIQVFDAQGKMISHQQYTENTVPRLSVSNWQPGLYFVQIQIDGKPIAKRLMVMR